MQSLAVGPCESAGCSRITMVVPGTEAGVKNLTKQLLKLIYVQKVCRRGWGLAACAWSSSIRYPPVSLLGFSVQLGRPRASQCGLACVFWLGMQRDGDGHVCECRLRICRRSPR